MFSSAININCVNKVCIGCILFSLQSPIVFSLQSFSLEPWTNLLVELHVFRFPFWNSERFSSYFMGTNDAHCVLFTSHCSVSMKRHVLPKWAHPEGFRSVQLYQEPVMSFRKIEKYERCIGSVYYLDQTKCFSNSHSEVISVVGGTAIGITPFPMVCTSRLQKSFSQQKASHSSLV